MTTLNPNLPAGLTEADLLALVEGEALPRERAAAVNKALAGNPACAKMVEALRRDRAALRAMGEVQAPAELMGAVESAMQTVLERQMLIGLSEGDAISDSPPVSIVMPTRSGWPVRRMAMAAGILLVVSGGVYTAMTMMGGGGNGTPRKDTLVASTNDKPAAPAPEKPISARPIETDRTMANAAPKSADDGATPATDTPATTVATITLDPTKIDSMYGPAEPGEIDGAHAAALAAEHRLVIRVTPPESKIDRVTDRLATVKRPGWQYAGEAPTTLASAVDPDVGRLPPPTIDRTPPRSFASDRDGPGAMNLNDVGPPAPAVSIPEIKQVGTVYVVNTRLDEASLDALCVTLRESGADVVYGEAERPLPIDSAPLAIPGAVVWWGSGPSGWTVWSSVPVQIQR